MFSIAVIFVSPVTEKWKNCRPFSALSSNFLCSYFPCRLVLKRMLKRFISLQNSIGLGVLWVAVPDNRSILNCDYVMEWRFLYLSNHARLGTAFRCIDPRRTVCPWCKPCSRVSAVFPACRYFVRCRGPQIVLKTVFGTPITRLRVSQLPLDTDRYW